ncbi:MAG TPA: glycine/sarcosine/betaine reductase component B subunit [Methylomirabilota bacterium]|nr:glycine/sarcosine/betaine reductase component B subunit [Methylomirabilota bacterium]
MAGPAPRGGMALEVGTFPVETIAFGRPAGWHDRRLVIDRDRVERLVLADRRLRRVAVDLVAPGEATRIVQVRDVIEPRVKVSGPGHVYPAIAGHPPDTVGRGVTHRYAGFAVMLCSEALPHIRRAVSAATDSLVDMSGPGAVTVYSTLRYLVLTVETAPDLELTDWNEALQGAAHRVADDLAALVRDQVPVARDRFALPAVDPALPRVVHVHTLNASMVPGIGTGIYGYTPHALPVLLHPNEILDGAITGDAVVGYPGKCTWLHVNNPVLAALYARHGRDLAWVGSIVARTRWGALADKRRSAHQTVKLAEMLGARGALVTWNHGGNDLIEVMLTIQGLEQAGIATVFLTIESDIKVVRLRPELAETGVDEPPLLFSVPEADAIVSTGTLAPADPLPAMPRVVGGRELVFDQERPEVRTPAGGPLDLEALSGAYSPIFGHFDSYGLGDQSYLDF